MNVIQKQFLPPNSGSKKRTTTNPAPLLAACAVDAALEKKAHDIVVMDMRTVSGFADFFVLCSGDSDLQVKAIADGIRKQIRDQYGEHAWHNEGYEHRQWVLLDYVDLVVHVFSKEKRAYYDLERLWGDAKIETVPDDGSAKDAELLHVDDAADASQPGS